MLSSAQLALNDEQAGVELGERSYPAPRLRRHVQLFYCRPVGDFAAQDAQVECLRSQYGTELEIEIKTPLEAARQCRSWVSTTQPTFLLLRNRETVASAVGRLPTREIFQLVQRVL